MTRQQRSILTIAILSAFVAFLDTSVITVALPAMSDELGGGLQTQQWIVDAYLITLGSLILVAGSLSDLFGRIRILRIGLIGFGLASLAIALAPTAELVIVARAGQGIAGALLVPSSLALILSAFRGAAQTKAIGTWTAITSAAFLAGPVLGGLFVQFLSWRLVFAINVLPIAVTLVMLARLDYPDPTKPGARVDLLGSVLAVVGLGGPVFALIEQERFGWDSPAIYLPLVGGVASLLLFVWWQTRAPHPMLPLGLFRVRNFSVGNLSTGFIYAALSVSGFITVIFLQQVAGFSPTGAALAFLPVSVANVALSTWFATLSARFGPRIFMTLGPLLAGLGHLWFLRMGDSVNYWSDVLPGVLVFAVGLSMTVAPLTSAILGSISAEQAGIGSAVNNAVARVAGLVGIALLGVVVVGTLNVANFHVVILIVSGLFFAGSVVSLAGITNRSAAR
jgi:EmrB/QacA subfamily drug resistance transporter